MFYCIKLKSHAKKVSIQIANKKVNENFWHCIKKFTINENVWKKKIGTKNKMKIPKNFKRKFENSRNK